MPTFGADPDEGGTSVLDPWEVVGGWQVRPKKAKQGRPSHREVIYYFTTHPRQTMAHSFDAKQLAILNKTVKDLLSAGYTVGSLKDGVDRLFASEACEKSSTPCQLFASRNMQQKVLREVDSTAVDTFAEDVEAVLDWIEQDFQRQGSLPWPVEDDRPISMFLMTQDALMALYTYPEVVASILVEGGEYEDIVYDFADAVSWSLGFTMGDPPNADKLRGSIINLPEAVLKAGGSRPQADSLVSAVARGRKAL